MSKEPRAQADPLSERTAREYEALVQAIRALEDALASPAIGREPRWKRGVARDLAVVVGCLQEHTQSAEGPEGLLPQVERAVGRSYDVSAARREHERLQRDAVEFLATLGDHLDDEGLTCREVRQRAAELANALRAHQAREADLLMEAFQRDIGVLD